MEEKGKISKSFKIFSIIFITLIIVFINPNSRRSILGMFNSVSKVGKELELVSEFTIDKGIKGLDIHDERIIEWEDNKLSFLDFNGFEVFKKDFTFKNPDISWGENTLYIMDRFSGDLYLLNKEGDTIGRKKLEEPFYKLQEEEDKLLIYRKDGDEETIDIVDEDGNLVKTHKENIPILTAALRERNGDYLISTLDISKELKSIATIYSTNDELVFALDIKDEIIVYSKFIKDNLLIATEKSLYFIEKGKIEWEKKYKDLKDIKIIDSDIYVLHGNKFEKINLKGKTTEEIVLSKNLENILETNEGIVLFGKNNIIMPGKNKDILSFQTKEEIVDLKYDAGNILIQKEGKLEIYKIKQKGEK